jgi:membrane-associated phospholipid phosphatase
VKPDATAIEFEATEDSDRGSRHLAYLSLFCSLAALGIVFWGFLQLDLPLTRFMRSVHSARLEWGGDWLARLGSGAVLAGISIVLVLIGHRMGYPLVFRTGLHGLLAHGLAALLAQILKHAIGRPRPRMTHAGEFEFGPSFASGLDSFPSGHASASFAVATVMARHYPRLGGFVYSLAAAISASRVWRGSHFPTDVLAGVLLGVLAGILVTYSPAQWRSAIGPALNRVLLALAGVFALLWTMFRGPVAAGLETFFMAGIAVLAIGFGLRWTGLREQSSIRALWSSVVLMAGLALMTASWLVVGLVLLAGLAWRLGGPRPETGRQEESLPLSIPSGQKMWIEAALAAGIVLAALTLQSLQGLLPLL